MNLWIEISRDDLLNVIKKVEILILNDAEVKMLAGDENLITASKKVLELSDGGILVVKKGEHGVIAFHPDGIIPYHLFRLKICVIRPVAAIVLQVQWLNACLEAREN